MTTASTGLAFAGAGVLGQIFSASLAAVGQPVTLLASAATADRLLTSGHIRISGVVDLRAPVVAGPAPAGVVGIITDPSHLPAGVGLIVTTKGQHVAAVARDIQRVWPAQDDVRAWVAGFQNGLEKDDLLVAAFGTRRVVGAVTITGGQRDPDGTIVMTSRGASYLGELGGGRSERAVTAARMIDDAGLPAEAVDDIQSVLWSKEANAVGVFGVSVLTRISAPRMMRRPDLARAYLSLVREVGRLAESAGVAMGDYAGFPIKTYLSRTDDENIEVFANRPFIPNADPSREPLPSMTQDLLAGRTLEVDAVFSDLLRRATVAGIDSPRIALVRDLIRGLDPGHYPE